MALTWTRRDKITSLFFGAFSLVFFFQTSGQPYLRVPYVLFWNLGCAFGVLSLAFYPQLLWKRQLDAGPRNPFLGGGAAVCAVIGTGCLIIGATMWLTVHAR